MIDSVDKQSEGTYTRATPKHFLTFLDSHIWAAMI